MALGDNAFGIKIARGYNDDGQVMCYASASEILGLGDCVIMAGDASGNTGLYNARTVVRASAGAGAKIFGYISGVMHHMNTSSMNLDRNYKASADDVYVLVVPLDTNKEYAIRANGTLTSASVGNVINLATITDANTTTGFSTMELDASSIQASGNPTYQFRIVGIDDSSSWSASTPVVRVVPNNLQTANITDGF